MNINQLITSKKLTAVLFLVAGCNSRDGINNITIFSAEGDGRSSKIVGSNLKSDLKR